MEIECLEDHIVYGDEMENDKQIYDKMDEIQKESSTVV